MCHGHIRDLPQARETDSKTKQATYQRDSLEVQSPQCLLIRKLLEGVQDCTEEA